jgi:pyridinium-3,5-bisthiocarboxylic acid mononucleotide nickel chelatase
MNKVLHVDPFGGVAGDMLLGALLDAGADVESVRGCLDGLRLPAWELEVAIDRQQGFAGTRVRVRVGDETHPARHLHDVEALLAAATLPERVRQRAQTAFRRLFTAEAEVHGVSVEKTHLHELGAVDAVIDIVGVCAALETLASDRVSCGPVPVGRGTVRTEHGLLPVPAPAVARLLAGVPLAGHCADGEMTTPTGATLLVTVVDEFSDTPAGRIVRTGVGLGTRVFPGVPNFLRVLLIEPAAARLAGRPLVIVEATVDDAGGESVRWFLDRARDAGALDSWCFPGTGRKGRPVHELRALCEPHDADRVGRSLFAEGATLGVRMVTCVRPELRREVVTVATAYGEIPVKLGYLEGRVVSVKPEHDSCAGAARRHSVSLAAVIDAAKREAPQIGSEKNH